jgi:biopolymer transport protein ExbD
MKKRREPLTPDLTALIDVVFILLIFFIVTSVFKTPKMALKLSLPNANAKEIKTKTKDITIALNKTKLTFNNQLTTWDKIDLSLQNIKKKDKLITIKIDKTVQYNRVVKLLDILQKYQLNNLALITTKQDK